MRLKNIAVSLLVFCVSNNILFAQEKNLDPITVTSTVTPIAASKTGRNITVIKGEQISKQPIQSIDDLLKYIPGVEVQQRGPMGAQADIIIRGGTYQQVLIVLDGIRLNDPLTGHFNSYIPIAANEIDRIEVLYGASSAIYGTEAVGGVIQVFTKSFSSLKNKPKNQLQAQTTLGEYGLFNMQIGGLYSKGKHTFAGGLSTNQTYGQPQRGTDGFVHNTTGSLSYSNKLNDNWSLMLRTAYDDRHFAAQNFYTTFKSDTAFEKVKTLWNHIKIAYEKGNKKLSFDAGYKTVNDYYKFNSAVAANENESSLFQSQIVFTQAYNNKTTATFGGQFVQKNITSNDRGNHHVPQAAAFAILSQQLGKYIFINPALRYDYSDRFGNKVVAQLNSSYKNKNLQLRASVGNTIRDADFTERYNNFGKPLVTSGSIGNPNLTAEQSFSYEFGADYWVKNNWKFTTSWFQRNQTDLIDFVATAYSDISNNGNLVPTGTYAYAKNIAKVNTAGLELTTQFNKTWKQQELFATISSLWMQSRTDENAGKTSFYINSHATFLFNFNVQYQYKNVGIVFNGLYKERAENAATAINATVTPNYFLVNTKANYTFPKKHIALFIEANNLFNVSYSDLLGTPMPNRWLMGGVQLKW
ncbi:MAG: TonB-dependent receptor plug domain-containing protein [Chitinophagaceae bacterium]